MKDSLGKYIFLFIALAISFIAHLQWFLGGVFTHDDWRYITVESAQIFSKLSHAEVWMNWSNYGAPDSQIYFLPFRFFSGILANIFTESFYYVWMLFTYFIPITVLPIFFSFILLQKFFNNKILSFIGSLLYSFSTYFIVLQIAHLTIALSYAFIPVTLNAFYELLLKRGQKGDVQRVIIFSVMFSIQIVMEPRIVYVLLPIFLIGLYFIRNMWRKYLAIVILVVLCNLYWFLPLKHIGMEHVNVMTSRPLFGSAYRSMTVALSSMQNVWTGGELKIFSLQVVLPYFWLLPFFAFVGILFFRKGRHKKLALFFYVIALLGVFLVKQEASPFTGFYQWAYNNIPGFNLFRESSKFYVLVIISYTFLILFSIDSIGNFLSEKRVMYRKSIMGILYFIIALIPLSNIYPIVNGSIGRMFDPQHMSQTYQKFNEDVVNSEEYYRNLVIPIDSRWITYTELHPQLSIAKFNEYLGKIALNANDSLDMDNILRNLQLVYSDYVLDVSSIEKIIVPNADLKDKDIFYLYGGEETPDIRQLYIEKLDMLDYLKKSNSDININELAIYENEGHKPFIRAIDRLIEFENVKNLEEKYEFIVGDIVDEFDFIVSSDDKDITNTIKITQLFEDIDESNILKDSLTQSVSSNKEDSVFVCKGNCDSSLSNVRDMKSPVIDYDLIKSANQEKFIFKYKNPQFNFENIFDNHSFENNLWTSEVGDCHNYDDNPILGMEQINISTDGEYSVELQAMRHTACTFQDHIIVEENKKYLFKFDYQSDNGSNAGYYIHFNDENETTIKEMLPIKTKKWNTFSTQVLIPDGATELIIYIYGYSGNGKETIVTRYDNFHLVQLPDVHNRYYVVGKNNTDMKAPQETKFDIVSPTKKLIHIRRATTPFFVVMSEGYHDKWQLQLNSESLSSFINKWRFFASPDTIANDKHFKYMTFLNGWYLDPVELCGNDNIKNGCVLNEDGSYDMELIIKFTPQRWFYLGLFISVSVFLIMILYLVYSFVKKNKKLK